jgi:hypothetical protein
MIPVLCLTAVCLALIGAFGFYVKVTTKERNRFLNAVLANTPQDVAMLERATSDERKTVVDPPKSRPIMGLS